MKTITTAILTAMITMLFTMSAVARAGEGMSNYEWIRYAELLAEKHNLATIDERYAIPINVFCNPHGDCWLDDDPQAVGVENLAAILPVWVGGFVHGVECPLDYPTCYLEDPSQSVGLNAYYFDEYYWDRRGQ